MMKTEEDEMIAEDGVMRVIRLKENEQFNFKVEL